jgi:hypothetical protein
MQNTPESQESEIEAIQTSPELGIEGRGVMSCDECGLVDHYLRHSGPPSALTARRLP